MKPETPTKYIFVTGGVISGLGKGISSASIGYLLKSRISKAHPLFREFVEAAVNFHKGQKKNA